MTNPLPPEELAAIESFTVKLGRALHRYGAPTHRLEEAMSLIAERLGVYGQFFATPTAIFSSFGERAKQDTFLTRVDPGEVDLGKLSELDEIITGAARGDLTPAAGEARIDAIFAAPPRYGALPLTLAFTLASGAAARFFGGGLGEVLASLAVGLVTGLLALAASRSELIGRIFVPLAAFAVSLIATALFSVAPYSVYIATLGGLIVLVPGLSLTVAMTEIATRHYVSGAARLLSACALFMTIGFGVVLGGRLGGALFAAPDLTAPRPLPIWTELLALLIAPFTFTVLFQARGRDAGWILISALLAFGGSRLGASYLGPELAVFLGALAVGIGSNLYARFIKRPAAVPLLPGIMFLVPGAVGFRSLSLLIAQDVLSGLQTAFTVTLIAAALVTGLLTASVIVPPRRAL
jgi:uncharacterized membrane protein YjjP (DUF1212 family)